MATRTKTVFLLRNSDPSQDLSLQSQREQCERFASKHALNVQRVIPGVPNTVFKDGAFYDVSTSGARTDRRAGFQAMLKACQAKSSTIGFIVCYDVSRFGRFDNDEAGYYRHVLRQAGVQIYYVAENLTGDVSDPLVISLKQWIGHEYLPKLSKDTQRGLVKVAEDGYWHGGLPPHGYDLRYEDQTGQTISIVRFMADGKKQILRLDGTIERTLSPEQQVIRGSGDRARLHPSAADRIALVCELFEMKASQSGYRQIARVMNERGIPAPRDGNWSPRHKPGWNAGTIRNIITNPVYTGKLIFNRTSFSQFHEIRRTANGMESVRVGPIRTNKVTRMAEENWIVVDNAHPALVSESLWNKANATATRKPHARGSVANYIFSGLIDCVACRHHFQGHTTTKGKPRKDGTRVRTRCYLCGGYKDKGPAICPQRWTVNENELWAGVLRMIKGRYAWLLQSSDFAVAIRERADQIMTRSRPAGPNRSDLEQKILEIDRKLAAVMGLDPKNIALLNDQITVLREQREALQERLQQAERSPKTPKIRGDATKTGAAIQALSKTIENASPALKRRFIQEFVDRIELDPRKKKGVAWMAKLPKSVLDSLGVSVRKLAGARYARRHHERKKLPETATGGFEGRFLDPSLCARIALGALSTPPRTCESALRTSRLSPPEEDSGGTGISTRAGSRLRFAAQAPSLSIRPKRHGREVGQQSAMSCGPKAERGRARCRRRFRESRGPCRSSDRCRAPDAGVR